MSGILGMSAAPLFLTATSVGVPSANFLKVCSVSGVKVGSSMRPIDALASSINGKELVPCAVAGYLYSIGCACMNLFLVKHIRTAVYTSIA